MSDEQALQLISAWLTGSDRLVSRLDREGYCVYAHFVSDAASMVQNELLSIIVDDSPVNARSLV